MFVLSGFVDEIIGEVLGDFEGGKAVREARVVGPEMMKFVGENLNKKTFSEIFFQVI